ncbi:MAG TPA: glycoside hydrolase family 36 protein [Gemmatimonadales bacterium]|jgi:hypothetical protein
MAGALAQKRGAARHRAPDNRWHFVLDAKHRWSLERGGMTPVRGAEISIELDGEAPIALSQLDQVRRLRTGSRRTGEAAWTVIGLHHGVEVTAEFEDDVRPRVIVHLRGLEAPRDLVAVHFTGGVSVTQRTAFINGYQSWSDCSFVPLDAHSAATGYWQLALLSGQAGGRGGGQELAFVFGEDDAASGEFHFSGRALDAVARFGHRTVSVDQSPAAASLGILPGGDPLASLGSDAAERIGPLRAGATPVGWCSWYELYARVSEEDVLASLEVARRQFDTRFFRIIQVDDGYQRAAGDWDTNGKFPHGHRWLTDRIHAAGFEAGLWMAPFAITALSGLPAIHPEWLLLGEDGLPLPLDAQPQWGGQAYALDASQRVVQDWLRDLARNAVNEWGYDYLKLDFLYYGARGTRPERNASGHEALRSGLRALKEGAGHAFVLGCGAPLQQSLGLVDGMRIGGDVDDSWGGVAPGATAAMRRAHMHGRAWRNDPDALVVREPLTIEEARAWASVIALSGQMTLASDRLDRLPPERLEILMRTMPAQPVRGRALDLLAAPPASAPALPAGETPALRLAPGLILCHPRDDWWMLGLINWSDTPKRMSADLVGAGVSGAFAAYDVWAGTRAPDVLGHASMMVNGKSATVLGLRRPRRVPFVLGSSRHVVQSFDLDSEDWDSRRRVLRGKSVQLDGRPYALTLALPPGFKAKECHANVDCTMNASSPRALVLAFTGTKDDISWSVSF